MFQKRNIPKTKKMMLFCYSVLFVWEVEIETWGKEMGHALVGWEKKVIIKGSGGREQRRAHGLTITIGSSSFFLSILFEGDPCEGPKTGVALLFEGRLINTR